MDNIDIGEGLVLSYEDMSMSLIYEGKKLILSSSGGRISNNLFYLFNQYLFENEIPTNFDLRNGKNAIKNKFLNLNILEKNIDGFVLNKTGNFILSSLVNYIKENKELFSSSNNLHYHGLFDECLNLVGDDGFGDLDTDITDTKISDTHPEDLIDPSPVSPVNEMLTGQSPVLASADVADSLSDNPTDVETGGTDYLLVYEESGESNCFIDKEGKPSPLAFDLLLLDLYSDVVKNKKIESLNVNSDSSVIYLKDMGFLGDDWTLKSEAYTFIDDSLLPELKGLCKNNILNGFYKDRIRQYLELKERFSGGDFGGLEETGIFKCFRDDSHVLDSVDADPSPVDQTYTEDDVVPDQCEADVSAYSLSHEEIGLMVGRKLLKWVDGILTVTDAGSEDELFMILYGNKIEAVNMQAVSDMLEEELSETGDGSDETYFKILEMYDIVERTDGFKGYKIMSGDIDVPLTDTKSTKISGLSAFATPEIYALEIIYEAHKKKLYLDERRLDSILQYFLKNAAKYGKNVLDNQSLVLFDENKGIHPGEYAESLLSIVSDFFQNGYEDIQKPEGIDFAIRLLNSIEDSLGMFYNSWQYKEFVDINHSDSEPEVAAPVSSDVDVPEKAVEKPEPKNQDFERYSWREKEQKGAANSPVIDMTPRKREIDEQLNNKEKFGEGIVPDTSLGIPDKVVCENGMTSIIYSGNGDGTSNQKKVIKTSAGFTDFGKNYIPGEDISLRDTESVAALKDGLFELNLFDHSGKLNELGKELLEALGINSYVISHLES